MPLIFFFILGYSCFNHDEMNKAILFFDPFMEGRINKKSEQQTEVCCSLRSGPCWARTNDPLIMSQML